MLATPSESGFVARVLTAWLDMRASMRSILDTDPGEGRILSFAMISGVVLFAAQVLELYAIAARSELRGGPDPMEVASGFMALVIVRPLMLYALAGLVGLVARAAGGQGSWRDTRAAVCWAAVVQAPVSFVLTLPNVVAELSMPVGLAISAVMVSTLAAALSYCIAEAHGFSRVWIVFAILGGGTALFWAGILFLSG